MSATRLSADEYLAGEAARTAAARAKVAAIHASGQTTMQWAIEQIEAGARRRDAACIKFQARKFIHRPTELNRLAWNLSQATATEGLAIVERLMGAESRAAHFPINTSLAALRAARLAGRWARRAERNGRMDQLLYGQVA